jgi:hypothetical protein
MDKIGILCSKDRDMLHEFSRRSIERIKGNPLLSLTMSFFSSYVEGNVKKEVEKDCLIITEAANAFETGRPVCDLDLEDIFEKTKKVDKQFLGNLMLPPFSISVRYSDFADIRIQRIWRISRTVYALLRNWTDSASFTDVVRKTYTEQEFQAVLIEILHLYNLETRMLGDAIRSPLHKAISAAGETLYQSMEDTMEELTEAYSQKIFAPVQVGCGAPAQ